MKKLLLGTVALAALGAGVTANAAELAVPRRAAYVAPVMYHNWTGCYIGGQVGDMWGHNNGWNTTGASTASSTAELATGATIPLNTPIAPGYDMGGFIGGFYGGCDYQVGAWVFGIETDWSNVNKSGQSFDQLPFFVTYVKETQERWVGTLRGRLGVTMDKWLLYVTGGVAQMRIDSSSWCIQAPISTALLQTDTRTGLAVGVGTEYALTYNWYARTQYLFVDIPSYTTLTPGVGSGLTNGTISNLNTGHIYNHIFEFGLSYKFGGKAPAVVTKG
jgi:outer membrane immunogenic protein